MVLASTPEKLQELPSSLMSVDDVLLEVWVHYLLYDDLPLLAKWVEVRGEGLGIAIVYVEVWPTFLSVNIPVGKDILSSFAQELAVEAEWAPSGMQQGWRYGKKEKDLRYIVFSRSGRFDMAGGRDWLYVETDQPHSTRVMEFFGPIFEVT